MEKIVIGTRWGSTKTHYSYFETEPFTPLCGAYSKYRMTPKPAGTPVTCEKCKNGYLACK